MDLPIPLSGSLDVQLTIILPKRLYIMCIAHCNCDASVMCEMCSMRCCRNSLDVFTGAASEDAMKAFVETTTVEFAELSQAAIEAYVESGEASTLRVQGFEPRAHTLYAI